jgi:protein-L-isoaspartate(D-aspartate) O-methyltransferase
MNMKKEDMIRNLKKQKFSENILEAFEKTDRSNFVPPEFKEKAYLDAPIPIGHGQTISQPYTIAFMLTLLDVKDNMRILEIGSGSGYVLALLSHLNPNGKIFGIERIKWLAEESKARLKEYKNIKVICGQGEKGLKEKGPFDRIIVSARTDELPQKLIQQLKMKGYLVTPVKNSIIVVKKESGENTITEHPGFVFVPLIEEK